MPWDLTLQLAGRLSMVATVAFILSRTRLMQRLVMTSLSPLEKALVIIIFSLQGIVGTYSGIHLHDALANSRVVGIMVAGLLGGPFLGGTVGAIAGFHRYLLGGFTASACAVAAIIEGLLAGVMYKLNQGKPVPWYYALLIGVVGEMSQMAVILIMSKPYQEAVELVSIIGLPMIIVNSIGIAVFMLIISSVQEARERIAAVQAERVLNIALATLPHLRQGLNQASAQEVAKLVHQNAKVSAVAITNREQILAHVGLGEDHHIPGIYPLTKVTQVAMETGEIQVARSKEEIGCSEAQCKLASAVVVPLKQNDRIVGVLKLYKAKENDISPLDLKMAGGLGQLFSTQLTLGEAEQQASLAAKAELRALQAQVNPHFLFNALNTVVSLIRTKPEMAREVLNKLANFFRHTLSEPDRLVTLREELAFTESYLAIEKARFGDKLQYDIQADEQSQGFYLPVCMIQPLVENAIKHGIKEKANGGCVQIIVTSQPETITIAVEDDGLGIAPEEQAKVLQYGYGKVNGLGLSLVNDRLIGLFGSSHGLQIVSGSGKGTHIEFVLPKLTSREGVLQDHENLSRG